jgi:biopolymer transport protein ExbB
MQFSIAHIWASMGLMSRLIAMALVLMAIASIAVVVERIIAFSRAAKESRRFARAAGPLLDAWQLEELAAVAETHKASTLARLFGPTLRRFLRAVTDGDGGVEPVELARREIGRRKEAIGADLRRGLSVLASVGSIAPFVGLLGTVVGIITAFQGIASSGSGGLGSVSAGIAEALIVTALGLAVAIPSVLCFNYLTTRIASIELGLERSAGELIDEMETEHGRSSSDRVASTAA